MDLLGDRDTVLRRECDWVFALSRPGYSFHVTCPGTCFVLVSLLWPWGWICKGSLGSGKLRLRLRLRVRLEVKIEGNGHLISNVVILVIRRFGVSFDRALLGSLKSLHFILIFTYLVPSSVD